MKILVSKKTISNWETGKTTPDLESLLRLSDLFNLSLDELIKGDKEIMEKIKKDTDTVTSNKK
ncbi:helix-turn-helix domain-containing protein [Vagococcus fluvialis]|uniref:helix-turn-helix domain-containing protein n=1 Tax=Vagococcus fluvialis TaxID=2738 RepID=UPI001A8C501E|nr:helix-turn-helix transcriptional regulator [Vagococcus fluvialis]MBO0442268.1 helix-turn-helix transcriptional regulator [Vagococcus fluvialis]